MTTTPTGWKKTADDLFARVRELEAEKATLQVQLAEYRDTVTHWQAENQSLREKIEAAGYSPNHDTDEIAQVERVLRQMVKRDAAKIKRLTAELAAVRAELIECQQAFENGRETERAANYGKLPY